MYEAIRQNQYFEIDRLRTRLFHFDAIIARCTAPPPPRPPSAAKERARKKERARRAQLAAINAERRSLGLVDGVQAESEPLPPPSLPLPVREVDEEPAVVDHVIADDIARRAALMIASGYSFGKRRSRRYEGLR
jgi:hypothetical protein